MNKLEVLEPFGPRIAKVKLSKEETKELTDYSYEAERKENV